MCNTNAIDVWTIRLIKSIFIVMFASTKIISYSVITSAHLHHPSTWAFISLLPLDFSSHASPPMFSQLASPSLPHISTSNGVSFCDDFFSNNSFLTCNGHCYQDGIRRPLIRLNGTIRYSLPWALLAKLSFSADEPAYYTQAAHVPEADKLWSMSSMSY